MSPADFHAAIQLLGEPRWQGGQRLVQQVLAGLAFVRFERFALQRQAELGVAAGADQE
jgi:hypothetical protein